MYSYATLDYSRGYRDENGQWETEYGEIKYRCENCISEDTLILRFFGILFYALFVLAYLDFIEIDY